MWDIPKNPGLLTGNYHRHDRSRWVHFSGKKLNISIKKEKKKEKKNPQATTNTYLNLKFTLPSCFQRGKKRSHHKCKKGTMQARWNTVYIMYHSHYFMLCFHWLKTGTHYTWFSMLFSSYHLPHNGPAIFFSK